MSKEEFTGLPPTEVVVEKVQWYFKYRGRILALIGLIVGIAGGNSDRVYDYATKTDPYVKQIEVILTEKSELFSDKISNLENRLDKVEEIILQKNTPVSTDDLDRRMLD